MSAWKRLNQQDAYVTTYVAKKSYVAQTASLSNYGIDVFKAVTSSNDTDTYIPKSGDLYNSQYQPLVYRSLRQLYYHDYNRTLGSITGSFQDQRNEVSASYKLFDHYEESSLTSASRYLNDQAFVISVPRNKFGTHIEPGSVRVKPPYPSGTGSAYVELGYIASGYFNLRSYYGGSDDLIDDGEGNLMLSGSAVYKRIGSVIYSHGMVIITDKIISDFFIANPDPGLSWRANQPVYTYNYNLKISDSEFNFTQNPTALTGSNNRLHDNVSGSSFEPYITSVGLYNDAHELIAVGKFAQPQPKPQDSEMSVKINLDY